LRDLEAKDEGDSQDAKSTFVARWQLPRPKKLEVHGTDCKDAEKPSSGALKV
jgi:hypothetical protein